MQSFTYDQNPSRVIFGAGAVDHVGAEVERLGATKAIVLSTPGQKAAAADIAARLGRRSAGVFTEAVMHVPIETARLARDFAHSVDADCAVAIGGGSTIGLGKAIALESALPILAIPTTYAGSEMTPIYGITEAGLKKTGRDRRVLPRTVIYDPALTLSLTPAISGASGMNAMAHCVEALYAQDANPITSLLALEGIRVLGRSLALVVQEPRDIAARSEALYGAWLAGTVLGSVGMSLHHKLCHTLGGSFNLPHAQTHTIVLPHVVHYNSAAATREMNQVAVALGARTAAEGLYDLAKRLGAKLSLREIGMRYEQLDAAAEVATRNPYFNPERVSFAGVRTLLETAYNGLRPEVHV